MGEQGLEAIDRDTRERLARELDDSTSALLERPDRTPEDDDRMLAGAHASAYLWLDVGGPAEQARSHWRVSRVYAVLGHSHEAYHHAQRCLELCEDHGLSPVDHAYAHEACARAVALARMRATARDHVARARELADSIEAPEDRERLLTDLATVAIG